MEEQQEGGEPSSALGGAQLWAPLGSAGRAGWGRLRGASLAFASLPARSGRLAGGGAAAHPWVLVGGLLRAGGGRRRFRGYQHHGAWTPVLRHCSPLPSAWHGIAPLHLLSRGSAGHRKPPLIPGKTIPRPPPAARLGSQRCSAPAFVEVRHQGVPGDAAGPPLPPHTETRSWGSRPWLGAAFSLVLKNLPGETISSDPKT